MNRHDGEKCNDDDDAGGDIENEVAGAKSLLKKYIGLLNGHLLEVLPLASSIASESWRHFAAVAAVLEGEVIGVLLSELVLCLTVFHLEDPKLLTR